MTIFESFRNEYLNPANHDLYKVWVLIGVVILLFLWCRMWFRALDGALIERRAKKIQASIYVCDWIKKDDYEKALAICKVRSIERTTKEGNMFKI